MALENRKNKKRNAKATHDKPSIIHRYHLNSVTSDILFVFMFVYLS